MVRLTILLTFSLASCRVAAAEPVFNVVHAFGSGFNPPSFALIQASDGNFYGTTRGGHGLVVRMTPSGTVTVLHAFTGRPDGSDPIAGLIQASDGNFYGTTNAGGAFDPGGFGDGSGTVFRMTPDGALTILHSFGLGTDGSNPRAALIQATDGNFYGTTSGTAFKMTPSGSVTVLHAFTGTEGPSKSALIQAADGDFYGVTSGGFGMVFKMTPTGTTTVLHAFTGTKTDGGYLAPGLIQAADGNFYGTSDFFGFGDGGAALFDANVFRMTPSGTVTVMHTFAGAGGATNVVPSSATIIQAADGNFYGTTVIGGVEHRGTVFRMTPDGTATVLHTFAGGTDGSGPLALMQAADGNLYGTTTGDYFLLGGTVFRITTGDTLTTLHEFRAFDGANPTTALVQGTDGNFYGTTFGDTGGSGTGLIFKMTPAGLTTVLHRLDDRPGGPLIQATDGNFYGTTPGDGVSNFGTVFKMTPSGTYTVLHSFTGGATDAKFPGGLSQATNGDFYGATSGGAGFGGTIFKMDAAGAVSIVHAFTNGGLDGILPTGSLIQTADGNFYGTTSGAGPSYPGTAFKMTPTGTVTVLHVFDSFATGLSSPSPLIQGADGDFYGTTFYGGPESPNNGGAIFKITPAGTFTLMHTFVGQPNDGGRPTGALIQASDGNFYGTTNGGGGSGAGTIFKMTPDGTVTVVHAFRPNVADDGGSPQAPLIQAQNGNLYGTTYGGPSGPGLSGLGLVFRLVLVPQPFSDDPVVAGSTAIKAFHITELRSRVDALRIRFGLAAFSWSDPVLAPGTTSIRAQHVLDVRNALADVYDAASRAPPAYTPGLAAGVPIRAAHIAELRAAVVALE